MMKKLIVFVLMLQIAGFSIAAKSLTYNKPVTLNGKVVILRSTHPNPTYRGEKQPAIHLNAPINVTADPEDDTTETEKNVTVIQLSAGGQDKLYNQLLHANGKIATIYCSDLFHSFTAHHTTKVLCTIGGARLEK
jgi:hypothetical protein